MYWTALEGGDLGANFWLWTWSATSLMGKEPKPVQEAKTIQLS